MGIGEGVAFCICLPRKLNREGVKLILEKDRKLGVLAVLAVRRSEVGG